MGGQWKNMSPLTTKTSYGIWGATDKESPSHEPHTTIFSYMLLSPKEEQELRRTTTYAASTAAERDMAKYTASTSQNREGEPLSVICDSLC